MLMSIAWRASVSMYLRTHTAHGQMTGETAIIATIIGTDIVIETLPALDRSDIDNKSGNEQADCTIPDLTTLNLGADCQMCLIFHSFSFSSRPDFLQCRLHHMKPLPDIAARFYAEVACTCIPFECSS